MRIRIQQTIQNLSFAILLISVFLTFVQGQQVRNQVLCICGMMILIQCIQMMELEERSIRYCFVVKMILLVLYLYYTGSWVTIGIGLALIDVTRMFITIQDYESHMAKARAMVRRKRVVLVVISSAVLEFQVYEYGLQGSDIFIFTVAVLLAMGYCQMELLLLKVVAQEQRMQYMIKKTALGELREKNINQELELRYQLADTNARLEERENIARNIHNVVGHTITSAIVTLQASEVLYEENAELGREKLEAAQQRMRMALEEIRRAVRVMDKELEKVSLSDFRQILSTKLDEFVMDTQIRVQHNLEEPATNLLIDKRFCEFFHSVLAEGLSNGIRHGNATAFLIHLDVDQKHIKLRIHDNGIAFENRNMQEQVMALQQGYGLKKISQFVKANGGKMSIDSSDGFTLAVELLIAE